MCCRPAQMTLRARTTKTRSTTWSAAVPSFNVDGVDQPVAAGSLVYVAAQVEHHFHSITEKLRVLVFFAPEESE